AGLHGRSRRASLSIGRRGMSFMSEPETIPDTVGQPGKTPAVRAAPALPSQIGRYHVTGLLGEGGFGRVYLAWDTQLERQVAIKVPHAHRISRPEDTQLYVAEARILARLDHPNIVPVYDFGCTDDGMCFVVSKLIEGSDLRKRLQQGPFPYSKASELV